jgi:aspartyl-tRNA(Asn)/glutamyl-tRNA(Gln) amidotransferase subunit A
MMRVLCCLGRGLLQSARRSATKKALRPVILPPGCAKFSPAFEVGPEIILDQGVNAGSFAFPINLSQQPAVSTPCGLTAAGLPIGLQFVGARGADAKVLSAARDFERASQ